MIIITTPLKISMDSILVDLTNVFMTLVICYLHHVVAWCQHIAENQLPFHH
jgi:hypothetical protein